MLLLSQINEGVATPLSVFVVCNIAAERGSWYATCNAHTSLTELDLGLSAEFWCGQGGIVLATSQGDLQLATALRLGVVCNLQHTYTSLLMKPDLGLDVGMTAIVKNPASNVSRKCRKKRADITAQSTR